jgi:hypothetical protein
MEYVVPAISLKSVIAQIGDRPRHILISDHAYKTWHAFVYYAYTGDIEFAPLSCDPNVDRKAAHDKHISDNPLLPHMVSCKSVYRLADKVSHTFISVRLFGV